MGNPTPRLPFTSFSGATPKFGALGVDWQQLEVLLERAIPEAAREKLEWQVETYFDMKRAEDSATTYADALRSVELMERQLSGLLELAHAPDNSDATHKARADWEYNLKECAIPLAPGRLWMSSPLTGEGYQSEFPAKYFMSMNDVSNIAIEMKVALNRVRNEYEQALKEKPKHFQPGSAFKRFGLNVRAWANEHEFPKTLRDANKRPEGTPLALFIFKLNQWFPPEYRSPVVNAAALGKSLAKELERRD
ncbi:hypothetical protein [Shinella sp. DD12]|uniref:hypothetical protein n=1 Tax=Shinella sp. DD12 TaxID=1410620 RepID=UPI000437BFD9|nr:hypothetical protein [Shinella sp. DD12]EYR84231.1 hypothetical protein SHLA_14c000130 [Shinella sp. DD12]